MIVSSKIIEDRAQRDGRRDVCELHVDHLGVSHEFRYLAESAADVAAVMVGRVSQLNAQLASHEIAHNLDSIETRGEGSPATEFTTVTQTIAEVRIRFQQAHGLAACRIAKWLLGRTDAQLRAAFGINLPQVVSLRSRLQAKANAGDTAANQEGE